MSVLETFYKVLKIVCALGKGYPLEEIQTMHEDFENPRFNLPVRRCTEFVMLTMVRMGEATYVEQSEIDWDKKD